jgi:MFS family permease
MVLLASLGGALEFYDFIIYGIFAPSIAAAFFPAADPAVGLLLSFAVFAGGYLARPLGGIVLGAAGDRIGRRRVFLASILVASTATVLMGLLPGYASLGVAATLAMVALRLVQGFCLGGELPGAIVYVVEAVPKRAVFVCAVLLVCVNTGVSLAALVNLGLFAAFTPEQVGLYGWRIAFLIGGLAGLGSYAVRRALQESPEFLAMKDHAARSPMGEVWHGHKAALLGGIGVAASTSGFNGMLFAYMPAYLTRVLHYAASSVTLAQNVSIAALSLGVLCVGYVGDRLPRTLVLSGGTWALLWTSRLLFNALIDGEVDLTLLLSGAALAASICAGVFAAIIADLFPARVRYSGVALSYNLSQTLFGGLFPLAASTMVAKSGPAAPGTLLAAVSVVTLITSLLLGRFFKPRAG